MDANAPAPAPLFGLDVAKDQLDIARPDSDALTTVSNDPAGIAKLPPILQQARHVRHFAKGLGLLAKTDALDAQIRNRIDCDDHLRPFNRILRSVPSA